MAWWSAPWDNYDPAKSKNPLIAKFCRLASKDAIFNKDLRAEVELHPHLSWTDLKPPSLSTNIRKEWDW